jgi:hypothetical protein
MSTKPRAAWITLATGPNNGKTICGLCCCERLPDGCDPCLGKLPGVANACCGHGIGDGYLIFKNGRTLRFDARTVAQMNGPRSFDAGACDAFVARGGELTMQRMSPDVPHYYTPKRRPAKRRRKPPEVTAA